MVPLGNVRNMLNSVIEVILENVTESQSHKIVGVGRHLKRHIRSNPPAKAGSLEQVAQVGVQTGLESSQRSSLHR